MDNPLRKAGSGPGCEPGSNRQCAAAIAIAAILLLADVSDSVECYGDPTPVLRVAGVRQRIGRPRSHRPKSGSYLHPSGE